MDWALTYSTATIEGASVFALMAVLVGTGLVARGAAVLVDRGGTAAVYFGVLLISLATTLPEIFLVGMSSSPQPKILSSAQADMVASLTGVYYPVGIVLGSTLTNLLLILGLTGAAFAKVGQGVDVGRITLWIFVILLALGALTVGSTYVWHNFPLPDFAVPPPAWIGGLLMGLGLIYLIVSFFVEIERRSLGRSGDAGEGARASGSGHWFFILFGLAIVAAAAYFLTQNIGLLVRIPFPAASDLVVSADQPLELNRIRYGMFGFLIVGSLVALPELIAIFLCRIGLKARRPRDELATGTILGASILNLCLLLGAAIVVSSTGGYPVTVDPDIFGTDVTVIMVAIVLIVFFFLLYSDLAWWEGVILFALWLGYWLWRFWSTNEAIAEYVKKLTSLDLPSLTAALSRAIA
jgi:Ca2+/Na+ antiporter